MEGKKHLAVKAAICLALAAAVFFRLCGTKAVYIESIRKSWGVALPKAEWEVYKKGEGAGFSDDRVRYHLFRYKEEAGILGAVSWRKGRNQLVEAKVNALLRDLEMEEEYDVNFDEEYHYYTVINRGDSSELFLLYFPQQKRLSVLEEYI